MDHQAVVLPRFIPDLKVLFQGGPAQVRSGHPEQHSPFTDLSYGSRVVSVLFLQLTRWVRVRVAAGIPPNTLAP